MSEKRKDNKGRILRTGESQRKDLIYQYRYTDSSGKRQTVYSSDLNELREKEKEIQRLRDIGINYSAGKISVKELLSRYMEVKQGIRNTTRNSYGSMIKLLESDPIGNMPINKVKKSDAKQWIIRLQKENGISYGTIKGVHTLINAAFKMACDEDVIVKNPFSFRVMDIIKNDSNTREALSAKEQDNLLWFLKSDNVGIKHYDMFVIFLGTGLRVSEFCGLTLKDLDFENRKIRIDHQLYRDPKEMRLCITKPKTESGVRYIPMTDAVYNSLKNVVETRSSPKVETMIDGYTGFVFLSRFGTPRVTGDIERIMKTVRERYNKRFPNNPLPYITPHVLRHTYCTNMVNAKVDIKSLQYLMGHSNVQTTLNVYSHSSYEKAASEIFRISQNEIDDEQCV